MPRSLTAKIAWVVTKDGDFRDGLRLAGSPRRLLVVATGNIANDGLIALFEANLEVVVAALEEAGLVEVGLTSMTIHDERS